MRRILPRELNEYFLHGTLDGMKLLDQYEAACKVRRLAPRTIQTYRRWVEECWFRVNWNRGVIGLAIKTLFSATHWRNQ